MTEQTPTVEQGPQSPTRSEPLESCPSCGAPAEPGQLACVNCGARLRVRYRRPPSWRLPAAVVAGVLVLLAVGAGFGLREIASEAEIESTKESAEPPKQPAPKPPTGSATGSGAAAPVSPGTPPEASPSTPSAPAAKPKPLTVQSWPSGAKGWTAILVSADSRAGAYARAREAVRKRIPAGVLHSSGYRGLRPGFWVVYAGRTPSRAKGQRLAEGYARKGFPGAYTRFVSAKK